MSWEKSPVFEKNLRDFLGGNWF